MNIKYDKPTLIDGARAKRMAAEKPSGFPEYNGAVDSSPSGNLQQGSQTRMAGQQGARALELMQNPMAAQNTNRWMELFGQSNQGGEFNAQKMQQAMQADTLAITNQQLRRTK